MNIEDLLREAAPGANDLFLSELPDPKDCHYTVSKRFERKMKKLLKRQKSPVLYWVQRSVACFLLVVLLGGASVLTFSAEARAAFFGWVREVYEDYFGYHFEGDAEKVAQDVVYRPTWLPDGYREVFTPDMSGQVNVIYDNDAGLFVRFGYSDNFDGLNVYVENDDAELRQVYVNNQPADLYIYKNANEANNLVWTDGQTNLIFWISAHLNEADLIQMAESVQALE